MWLNMVAFDPLEWKSETKIQVQEGVLRANFEIDSSFQLITYEEEKLWDQFVLNYENTLQSTESFLEVNASKRNAVKNLNGNILHTQS